ncbi:MAG: hypothetical protein ACPGU9_00010 [Flavobacteriaceae bacterium]
MNKILFTLAFFFTGIVFAQETSIEIGPKNFKNTILFKAELTQKTNLTIDFLSDDIVVKQMVLKDVVTKALKIDLKEFHTDKTYTVNVYNDNKKLLYTYDITKSLKR